MGPEAPTANAAKLACNMMITMAIEAMAEAVVLTEANGLPRDRFFELILGTLFGSCSYQVYLANIAKGNYEAGFKAALGLKDLRLAKEAAEQADSILPMLDAVHRRIFNRRAYATPAANEPQIFRLSRCIPSRTSDVEKLL